MGSWDADEKKQTHPRAVMIKLKSWLRKRSMKEKIGLGVGAAVVVRLHGALERPPAGRAKSDTSQVCRCFDFILFD